MSDLEYIGQMVKALRKWKNISQIDLVNLSGISKTTIQNIESGKHINLEMKTMIPLFMALDFPSIPIISLASTEEERSKRINEMVGMLTACDMETLRASHRVFENFLKMVQDIQNPPRG
jgi:transcriptional regulator with XRE-family HTH domain